MKDVSTEGKIARLSSDDRIRLKQLLKGRSLKGSSLVAKALVHCGIKRLSGVGGLPSYSTLGESAKLGIRILGTRRQFSATIMAGVDNYISGELVHAVCLSPGPGLTDAVTGILVSRDNNLPLLIVGSRTTSATEGSGDFQDFDATSLLKPITKWAVTVRNAGAIMPILYEACEIAISNEPGPVFVQLPEDVLEDLAVPVDPGNLQRKTIAHIEENFVRDISHLLNNSERPLLCLGEDLRWDYSGEILEKVVSGFQLPFITTPLGRGMLPDDHPLCANHSRRKVIHCADMFLLVGAWFDWRLRKGSELPPDCRVVHVHPNPDQLGRNVQPAIACCAEPMSFFQQLAERASEFSPERDTWMSDISDFGNERIDPLPVSWKCDPEHISPRILFPAIRRHLQRDHVIVADGNIHLSLTLHYLDSYLPYSRFDPGRNGCIGCGIPQAMGAALALPSRPIVAIVGDTGFGMTGMELETAVRHGMDFKLIITNNSGNSGRQSQLAVFGEDHHESVFQFQENLPYHEVAKALGVPGWSIESPDHLDEVLDAVFSVKGPACVNVRMDPATPHPRIW